MSSVDKDIYRLVPYRFAIDETNTDMCKLEKLANLFPEMKGLIELELFKINHLQNTYDRLSSIYTATTAIDTRDDTFHVFLGPYHLSLGPAIFGALRFRNISRALLASSQSNTTTTTTTTTTKHYQKRRHDAVIRRFRRSVRKLILIKSIIDQLRLASILTPYNQYELYTQGIYDLVLAGHKHSNQPIFQDDYFMEQINNIRSMNYNEKNNSLLASKYIKINTLLHLLSPTSHQHQSDNNLIDGKSTPINRIDDKINENPSKSIIDSSSICCSQHIHMTPTLMFSITRSMSVQPTQLLPYEPRSRLNSKESPKSPSPRSRTNTRSSLPNLNISDQFVGEIESKSENIESKKSTSVTTLQSSLVPSSTNTNQEDAFIDRISTLLTNYVASRQSTGILSQNNDNHEKLGDSRESISSQISVIGSDVSDVFNQFSSINEYNEVDKLLQRIKKVVDNKLSVHPHSSHNSTKTTATNNLRQQLLISRTESQQEGTSNEYDIEYPKTVNNRRKLLISSKSQSFDESNIKLFSTIPESNE